ncbi:hypothetical protein M8494_16595 [Serratia ureilytica]
MNILGCLDKPSAGVYRVAGRDVATLSDDALAQLRREHFGFSFPARYHLLPHRSAAHNVKCRRCTRGWAKRRGASGRRRCCGVWGWGSASIPAEPAFRRPAAARQHRPRADELAGG